MRERSQRLGDLFQVRVDQVWRDDYPGEDGKRTVRVVAIEGDQAVVETVTVRFGKPGRRTRIRLDRFRPGNRGYSLVEEA